ncbi:hypothetical protein E3P99_02086 [Wallemia hederae]|uniref:Maintenance of ploidy protein mob2 n=1 Tax=Wallemia hederae TaxID=1540922 RepID=A0A4T0FPH2_9BASI|nr:hypothetical protein E3P99_02086 [Wallemia hederae]
MSNFFGSIGRIRTKSNAQKRSPTSPTTQQQQIPQIPSSNSNPSKPLFLCQPFVKAALVKGSFKTIVVLPKHVDVNEWVAINLFDFFHNLNAFYGVISETVTIENNPTMSAGVNFDYTWIDQSRKLVKLPAPTYIDYVMVWVQSLLNDELVFPTKQHNYFQPTFPSSAKHIYKQLFRVFAHLYWAHFTSFLHLSLEGHLNSLFAHFVAFGTEFDLIDQRDVNGSGVGELMKLWKDQGTLDL